MATTVSYSASMRTRKTNSASNAKSSAASQEYYENTYNYVGVVHFAGMALSGKVITGITLRIVAAQAGYGTGHTKTVYVRKSNYQSASQSGITGLGYCGDPLGTFTGAFYGNTSTYTLSGDLLNNLAAYIAAGNNTICLYNPNPAKSSQGYSTNYLQWTECTITVTYEEAASKPSLSKTSFDMGTTVTIYTNRQSSIATHTLRYSFFSSNGTIATGVTDSCTWAPPISLAAQIPSATSGWGTIYCDTYVNGSLVSTNTCAFQLTVPASIVPSISSVSVAEATAGIADRFGGYVRTRSKLAVSIAAAGNQGSSVSSYRTGIDNVTYSGASFTTNTLNTAGSLTMTVTVTDSRGRTASATRTVTVLDYSPPSLSLFSAERCNDDGSAPQTDGTKVRISAKASGSSVGGKNTLSCTVYYKLSSAESWVSAVTLTPSNYVITATNRLLSPTFDTLNSYDVRIRVQDVFYYVEQTVSMLHSLAAQVSYYSERIQRNPEWEYAGVFADFGLTGTKETRPEFQRMLKECREGKIDLILVKTISRFARNTLPLLNTVRELKGLGIGVYFEEQQLDTLSGDGEFMLTILASFAQEESRSVSENCKWRIRKKFEQGISTGFGMYGYEVRNGSFAIKPEEAAVVRRIFQMYLGGIGSVKIMKLLTEEGVPAPLGGLWNASVVMEMLKNEKYAGDLLLQKFYTNNHVEKKRFHNRGELPQYFVGEDHEPIIARETFDAVQQEIAWRAAQRKVKRNAQEVASVVPSGAEHIPPSGNIDREAIPLTDRIYCGICGKKYRYKVMRLATPYAAPVWICSTFNYRGKAYCASKQIPEDILKELIASALGTVHTEDSVHHIEMHPGNRVLFVFQDGHTEEHFWKDHSRKNSWDAEKRRKAAEKTRLQHQKRKEQEQ